MLSSPHKVRAAAKFWSDFGPVIKLAACAVTAATKAATGVRLSTALMSPARGRLRLGWVGGFEAEVLTRQARHLFVSQVRLESLLPTQLVAQVDAP